MLSAIRRFEQKLEKWKDDKVRARIRAARFGHVNVDGQFPSAWEAEVEEAFQEGRRAERTLTPRQRCRMVEGALLVALVCFSAGAVVGQKLDANLAGQMILLSDESRIASDVRFVTEGRAFRTAIQAELSPAQQQAILARVKAGTRSPQAKGSQRGVLATAIYGPDPAIEKAIRADIKELLPDRKPTP